MITAETYTMKYDSRKTKKLISSLNEYLLLCDIVQEDNKFAREIRPLLREISNQIHLADVAISILRDELKQSEDDFRDVETLLERLQGESSEESGEEEIDIPCETCDKKESYPECEKDCISDELSDILADIADCVNDLQGLFSDSVSEINIKIGVATENGIPASE